MDYLQYTFQCKDLQDYPLFHVLNLIINGLPSIPPSTPANKKIKVTVLNLIINGLPSILVSTHRMKLVLSFSFKPYYKWITFNTFIKFIKSVIPHSRF